MTREGLRKIMESPELTKGEKAYIFDFQYHHAGDFMKNLWQAIARADENNLHRLELGFPDEVQGFLAWTRGNLYERASHIAGGNVGFLREPIADE